MQPTSPVLSVVEAARRADNGGHVLYLNTYVKPHENPFNTRFEFAAALATLASIVRVAAQVLVIEQVLVDHLRSSHARLNRWRGYWVAVGAEP
jgi:hypothetical protein